LRIDSRLRGVKLSMSLLVVLWAQPDKIERPGIIFMMGLGIPIAATSTAFANYFPRKKRSFYNFMSAPFLLVSLIPLSLLVLTLSSPIRHTLTAYPIYLGRAIGSFAREVLNFRFVMLFAEQGNRIAVLTRGLWYAHLHSSILR
jgi:hypothetical protein